MRHFRYSSRWFIIPVLFVVIAALLTAGGCARRRTREQLGPTEAWEKAKSLFERERYVRAREILRDIALNYSGSAIIDSAQFYLGRTSFELRDYLIAADEFHRVVNQFPYSATAGDAMYYEARSYYEEAPSYQLDQAYTRKALERFQQFLEDHNGHALTDSGYHYLNRCRDKLARKEYTAARLYHDLGEYASAILYATVVLDNYYDTAYAPAAQFLKGRSYFALKDWDRAQRELQAFLDGNPHDRFRVRARQMLALAQRNAAEKAAAIRP